MALDIKQLDKNSIAEEHICCGFSDKKCRGGYLAKKRWLIREMDEGYMFKKLDVRGKVFIEYCPAEKAWLPVIAKGYMLINCFWVSGKYKGHGYGRTLLEECKRDAEGMNGLVTVVAETKQPYLSDRNFFKKQGFQRCDTASPYFELWYLPFKEDAPRPCFKACATQGICDRNEGLVVYYSNACPFTEYYVHVVLQNLTQKRGLSYKIVKLESREQAQNHFVPHTIYSVFLNGKFATQQILTEKLFDKFIPKNELN